MRCEILAAEIRFYRASGKYGFLSNLHPSPLVFDGREFRNAEEAYQFGKPKDPDVAEWIVSAPTPRLTAMAGHLIPFYDTVDDWQNIRVDRMKRVLWAKFRQNYSLRKWLLETENQILIEDSKTDPFWGRGKSGKGRNMLGKLLMEVRDELRKT